MKTLEEKLALYLRQRWDALSPESRNLLFGGPGGAEYLSYVHMSWERDFWRSIAKANENV